MGGPADDSNSRWFDIDTGEPCANTSAAGSTCRPFYNVSGWPTGLQSAGLCWQAMHAVGRLSTAAVHPSDRRISADGLRYCNQAASRRAGLAVQVHIPPCPSTTSGHTYSLTCGHPANCSIPNCELHAISGSECGCWGCSAGYSGDRCTNCTSGYRAASGGTCTSVSAIHVATAVCLSCRVPWVWQHCSESTSVMLQIHPPVLRDKLHSLR